MARFEEKEKVFKNHPKLEKALFWSLVGLFSLIAIAAIVIIVLMIIGPQDKDEEEEITYEETYKNAELITFEDLENILDKDVDSELSDGCNTIYVYVYSPNYDKTENDVLINEDELDSVRTQVNACIDAYGKEVKNNSAFFVINVTTEDNKDSNFLANNGFSISDTTPLLLVITTGADAFEIDKEKSVDGNAGGDGRELSTALADIANALKTE